MSLARSGYEVTIRRADLFGDLWILSALLVALVIRLTQAGSAALWLDETVTATWVKLPWLSMLRTVLGDNHLPFYPALIKAWSSAAGSSPWALRLPSVICSWATVALVAALAWMALGQAQARWAAWFAALSPYLLQHAQEARMYALLGMLSALSMLLLAAFILGRSRRLGVWFVVVNSALIVTHYYAVFLIGGQGLALLFLRPKQWRRWLPAMAATCLMIVLAAAAAKYLAYPQAGGHYQIGWITLPGMIWSLISGYTLMPSSEELHTTGARAAIKYLPLAFVSLIALSVIGLAALRSTARDVLWALLTILASVLLGPFVVAAFFDVAINPRYAMAAMPALILLLACGCTQLPRSGLYRVAPVALLACMLIGSMLHLVDPGHGREDVYGATRWLDTHVPANEPILVTSDEMAILARFHWPERNLIVYPPRRVVVSKGNAEQVASQLPWSESRRIIYVMGREWLSDPDGALRAALRTRYDSCLGTQVRGIQVLCFTKPGA
jgi:mannosyltransferase